ncbi:sialidase family protein [Cohnella sp. 56]|uniref:sialidase family protein n=1 Tax=Cohnella sp. 56 TaxID=3113722 RepID=UPI0030EAC055
MNQNALKLVITSLIVSMLLLSTACSTADQAHAPEKFVIDWEDHTVVVNDDPLFESASEDVRHVSPGSFGSEYARMTKLSDKEWIMVYTVYRNQGYFADEKGGTSLEVAISQNKGRSWKAVSVIGEPGRDMDNGQIVKLKNGDLLLAGRSVRWQESYRLPVYKSTDKGRTWKKLSEIDANEGTPGSLGDPDKGVYEPYFQLLDKGELAVFYANEKHVTETPVYSQTISEKISKDNGKTWGEEIFVAWTPDDPAARPGMPIASRLKNGKYVVAFEVCGTYNCNIFVKSSDDGVNWEPGIGTQVPVQSGGPYIAAMKDGSLLLTSNSNEVSMSIDDGASWELNPIAPWNGTFPQYLWASLYQTGTDEVAAVNSIPRDAGGHRVEIRFGKISPQPSDSQ